LPNGSHNITVYGTEPSGSTGASETIIFTIETQNWTWTAIAIATAAIIGVALLIYLTKNKKKYKK
jgi:hypothetical protein